MIFWPLTHDVLRLACACDHMTAGAKLPWQVASAVCVRGLQVAMASCDRCMCGIMAGCYRNLRSPYVRGLTEDENISNSTDFSFMSAVSQSSFSNF